MAEEAIELQELKPKKTRKKKVGDGSSAWTARLTERSTSAKRRIVPRTTRKALEDGRLQAVPFQLPPIRRPPQDPDDIRCMRRLKCTASWLGGIMLVLMCWVFWRIHVLELPESPPDLEYHMIAAEDLPDQT